MRTGWIGIAFALVFSGCLGAPPEYEDEENATECPMSPPGYGAPCEGELECRYGTGCNGTVCACQPSGRFLCGAAAPCPRDGGLVFVSQCPAGRPPPGIRGGCAGRLFCVYPRDCADPEVRRTWTCGCHDGVFDCSGVDDPCPRDAGPRDGGDAGVDDAGPRDAGDRDLDAGPDDGG